MKLGGAMAKLVYAIEGLDRLGKSTLIEGMLNRLGYYQVIHFSKPQQLGCYQNAAVAHYDAWDKIGVPKKHASAYVYQHAGFMNSMILATSGANIIFDRWHLGESVYSPMYREYDGDYVFNLEKQFGLDEADVRLILLTEDFEISKHFVDDGESLGPMEKREEEQKRFITAFGKSCIRDKRIVSVTDPALGGFKPKDWILEEALA
jgi:thymidylate kinase